MSELASTKSPGTADSPPPKAMKLPSAVARVDEVVAALAEDEIVAGAAEEAIAAGPASLASVPKSPYK